MKSVRKLITYLLLLTLPFSAWASVGAPCAQNSGTEFGAETAIVDAHAHHAVPYRPLTDRLMCRPGMRRMMPPPTQALIPARSNALVVTTAKPRVCCRAAVRRADGTVRPDRLQWRR